MTHRGFPVFVLVGAFAFLVPGQTLANVAPVVDGFSSTPAAVAPGGTVTITLEARDPDCPDTCTSGCGLFVRSDLTGWSATGGTFLSTNNGTSASPYLATAQWQAPATEGTYTISVYVADSGTFVCGGRQTVNPGIDVQVTSSPNRPPVIESLSAVPLQLFPGADSTLSCAATDPDGDTLSYAWQADSGTVTPGLDGAATFTADAPGIATVTCRATDPAGLFAADSMGLSVTGALAEGTILARPTSPWRLSVDAQGNVYALGRSDGTISVFDLFSGSATYRLPLRELTAVAVDWNGDLLVGSADGARLVDRRGAPVTGVSFPAGAGEVSDVAVDAANRRYGVLHAFSGRIAVHDELGAPVLAFGSTGDGPAQLRAPRGLAVTSAGEWVVADSGHGLIKVFSASGALLRSFGGLGGGAGEFVRLDDVEVDGTGTIWASDGFQDWIQAFAPDGTPRETLGTFGDGTGEFKTAAGLAWAGPWDRLLAASTNSSSIHVFRTSDDPLTPPPPAVPSLAPAALVFGETAIGYESEPLSLTLTNSGGSLLGISGIATGAEFAATEDCGGFVDPGATCTIDVVFAPGGAGPRSGTLTVETSGRPARVAVPLAGQGFVPLPDVALAPTLLVFGDQVVGTVGPPMTVVLTNTGLAALAVQRIAVTADYLAADACPASLAPGAGCAIEVRFAPSTVGESLPGTLAVTSDAAGSPHVVALDGRATPVVPGIAIAGATVDEGGPGETVAAVFTVTLSEPTTEAVTVDFATSADTAFAAEDFLDAAGTLTFLPGELTQTFDVTVLGDDLLEPDEETFTVHLAGPLGGVIDVADAAGTILDDEPCVGPNLLANASAEQRPDVSGVPGWTQVVGTTWQRRAAPPAPVDGDWYFYPGTTDPVELAQDVDLAPYAVKIDAGEQWFGFEGWVHTLYEADPRTARLVVEYRDALNETVLDAFDTGEFSSPSIWQRIADERPAPPGTRWIRVRLIATQLGDAYFDALRLHSLRAATVEVDDVEHYEGDPGIRREAVPVRLACPFHEPVALDYLSSDETAAAGADYLAAVGTATLHPGETATSIPVDIVGDVADEPHETFRLELSLVQPSAAVLLDDFAVCTIRNDDFCPRTVGHWRDDPTAWPVTWLVLGGVEYDQAELLSLLGYSGSDPSHLLAAELIATRLNLAVGSEPSILPDAEDADAFLATYPPGSRPQGPAKQEARALHEALHRYNAFPCSLATSSAATSYSVEFAKESSRDLP